MTKIPHGFRLAGTFGGIKSSKTEDITLIAADRPCVAAGVYTRNQVVAAPVVLDRERTPSNDIRTVIVNSGNANACTGELGMQNAKRMTALAAEAVGCSAEQTLVMSTGIIGAQLPMDKVEAGITAAAKALGNTADHLQAAARGIITTDTKTKIASFQGHGYCITGIAKGSGMIGPKMATMLGIVLTDASLAAESAQRLLTEILTAASIPSVSTVTRVPTIPCSCFTSGNSTPLAGKELEQFSHGLENVCIDLAKQIVIDGEGATHLIEIAVSGADSDSDARVIAEAIANSPLVKTAFAGNDPNWGRIVSAAGYAGPKIDVERTSLQLNRTTLYENGTPVAFDALAASKSMQENRDILVELVVGKGSGSTRFWTCDLTHEYVTINAEYHT